MRLPRALAAVAAVLCLATGLAPFFPAAGSAVPEPSWPDTDVARHARAWLTAYHRGEAAMRAMLPEHFAPEALRSAPVETRIGRYREIHADLGTLTPVAILEASEASLRLGARAADGRPLTLEFECEPAPPHRVRAIRIMLETDAEGGAPAGPPLSDEEAVRAMRELVAHAAAADSFSGAVLLARDGRPLLREAWNWADREARMPNGAETRFNLGSINKVFTRVAIAQLVERGRLSLDDTLTRWLPDWPGRSASKITVALLADHRAGIGDFFGPRYEAADRSKLRHNRDYLPLFRDEPLWFEPGTSQRYSNGSYVLLGEIIARAAEQDYYDYMRAHVWAPAGMTATAYLASDDTVRDVAMGYTRGADGRGPLRDNLATRPARGSAAGGGYSTLDDLLRFDQALLAHRLCAPGWTTWVLGGPPPARDAQGPAGDGVRPAFVLAGGAPGISAEYAHEGPFTLIVLGNLDPPFTREVATRLRGVLRRMRE